VGIARAIVADPTVVVADEPTGSLDAETAQQILDLLVRLNGDLGTTLLLVTHDPDIAAVAGRRLRLVGGQVAEDSRRPAVAVHQEAS
jgi:putative ABC transport system ATP-binding protein